MGCFWLLVAAGLFSLYTVFITVRLGYNVEAGTLRGSKIGKAEDFGVVIEDMQRTTG